MKGVSGGAETTSMWEASGKKSCNESNTPVWLDHSLLLKCVTVLSHPEADNTHTYCSLLKVSLAFCHISAHHLWFWGTHQSFANQGLHSKNNNKNRKAVIKFYFYHKFPGKKWETHTHTLWKHPMSRHIPFLQYSCRVCDPQPEIKQDWRVSHLSGRTHSPRWRFLSGFLVTISSV